MPVLVVSACGSSLIGASCRAVWMVEMGRWDGSDRAGCVAVRDVCAFSSPGDLCCVTGACEPALAFENARL